MASYLKNYITPEYYNALQHMGLNYQGFVTGMGYAYTVNFAIAPPHMSNYNPPRFVPPGMDFFIHGKAQCLDTSEELVAMSYNLQVSDIEQKLVRYNNSEGTVSVNMGNNVSMTLPQANAKINISISDGNSGAQIVSIEAINTLTGESKSSRTKLVDMPVVFGDFGGGNNGLKKEASKNDSNGGVPNLTNRVGGVDYLGYYIDGIGLVVEQAAKETFKYGKRIRGAVKSGAQLTTESAAILTKAATRLNVLGAAVGSLDCTMQGVSDYQNGNTGLATYEFSKAVAYTTGIVLIIISPLTAGGTAVIGGYIILGTGAVDITGDVGMYIYGRNQ